MKRLAAAALVLAASPLFAHSALRAQQTGVSHPADAVDEVPAAPANVPVVAAPVVVIAPPAAVAAPTAPAADVDESSPAVTLKHHDLAKFTPDTAAADTDAEEDIVQAAPLRAGELPVGTLLRARLQGTIQTASTAAETPFAATLAEPVQHMGQVVFPAGSTIKGRITEIHGGKRFRGAALIHLQAQSITLPDGHRLPLHAAVIDTDQYAHTRIDGEGNIVRKDHAVQTLTEISLATGSGAAAGGVLGGVPGALIGAGIGAGVSTAVWLKQDRQTALPNDTLLVLSLTVPTTIDGADSAPQLVRNPAIASPAETDLPAPGEAQAFVPSR